jgi:outer membrane biosynthesis protein TonB
MTLRVFVPRAGLGAARGVRSASHAEAPASRSPGLAMSIALHALLIGMLTRPASAPPLEIAETYDVSLQPPAAVVLPAEAAAGHDGDRARPLPYWAAVRSRIARGLSFPADVMASRAGPVTILVRIEIAPDGRLLRVDVVTPNADPILVQLVMDAIHRSEPFPAPKPRDGEPLILTAELPIRFVAL